MYREKASALPAGRIGQPEDVAKGNSFSSGQSFDNRNYIARRRR